MPAFTAADVKRLRDTTGAGMMDAKRALQQTDGDFAKAVEALRISGAAKAAKRGVERTASNGLVAASEGAMIELACETDFVAKNDQFQQLAADIVAHVAASKTGDVDAVLAETLADGRTVAENIDAVGAVIGEKVQLRRVVFVDGQVAAYMHRRATDLPPQVGVLVEFHGDDPMVARAVAMQVAAMRPRYVSRDEVPSEVVDQERKIATASAKEQGRPEQAVPRIVEGRVNAFFKETVLLDQPSVQDVKRSVGQVLDDAGVTVRCFARFEVGQA